MAEESLEFTRRKRGSRRRKAKAGALAQANPEPGAPLVPRCVRMHGNTTAKAGPRFEAFEPGASICAGERFSEAPGALQPTAGDSDRLHSHDWLLRRSGTSARRG